MAKLKLNAAVYVFFFSVNAIGLADLKDLLGACVFYMIIHL